jgi:hypothetical protein
MKCTNHLEVMMWLPNRHRWAVYVQRVQHLVVRHCIIHTGPFRFAKAVSTVISGGDHSAEPGKSKAPQE